MTQLPQSPQLDPHSKISTTDHQSSTHQTLIASMKAAACPTLTVITTSERTYISQKKTSTMT